MNTCEGRDKKEGRGGRKKGEGGKERARGGRKKGEGGKERARGGRRGGRRRRRVDRPSDVQSLMFSS